MAEYVELYIDQGTDFNTTLNINDDDTNVSQNIIGYVVTSSLKRSILSTNVAANFVCQVTNSSEGQIEISMTAANTANLRPGKYFFDVKVNDTVTNAITRLIEGVIFVQPGVTG